MSRLWWPAAVVAAFVAGWALAGISGQPGASRGSASDVENLRQQVTTLQARLHARESLASARAESPGNGTARSSASAGGDGTMTAAMREERMVQELRVRAGTTQERAAVRGGPAGTPPTVEAVLERFYRYLDATRGGDGRERWREARDLVEELRGMGDVAAKALMHVLASGHDSDERRAAARLLGTLQIPQALPVLKDIIENDDDVLLRRAAAFGLRRLQTPESVPVMERLLANGADDRFVRLAAAQGLADAHRPQGVNGLAQIFNEAALDGRGREMAFRALVSLDDGRAVPFMRHVIASDAEPSYRLRAIQYVTAQGDRQALPSLQVLMKSPTEQPSIRDAAAQAYRTLGGK